MQFDNIINARINNESDKPKLKKNQFKVSEGLQKYLRQYGREISLPIAYRDLLNHRYATSLKNKKGKLTHWETANYDLKVLANGLSEHHCMSNLKEAFVLFTQTHLPREMEYIEQTSFVEIYGLNIT